jgi:hypothetical protein
MAKARTENTLISNFTRAPLRLFLGKYGLYEYRKVFI